MFNFFSYLAAIFVFLGRSRTKWLWFPALVIGIVLFWVFLTWNRIPSFCDRIEIRPVCNTGGSAVAVSVIHPYFSFNKFSDNFVDFWSEYGSSIGGVSFTITRDSVSHPETNSPACGNANNLVEEARKLFPDYKFDSIGPIYEFRVRKELFGNMDARNARDKLIQGSDEKGFCIVRRKAGYYDNICVDSTRILAGVNKSMYPDVPVGYRTTMYYTLMRLLRLEDISQFNYSIVIEDKTAALNRLEVDFGGPVELKGLWPVPDIIEPSRIVYRSKDKIAEIKETGTIRMFCQSLESATVQNVRMFVLTTLGSLCFAYTLKEFGVFILFVCRKIKRKCDTEKIDIEGRIEKMGTKLHNCWRTLCKGIKKIF